jgi:hypothetical protein
MEYILFPKHCILSEHQNAGKVQLTYQKDKKVVAIILTDLLLFLYFKMSGGDDLLVRILA